MTDFLIIGGGIAGLSAAARVSALGHVTLCEAEAAFGHHASGRSAALYEPQYGLPPVVELSLASGAELAAAGVLSPRGLLLVAGPGEEAAFRAEARAMRLTPVPVDQARALVPILDPAAVSFAAIGDGAQDIDTDRLLQTHLRSARAAGADLRLNAGVTAIARDGAVWRVQTTQGEVTARCIINAAGAWADRVALLAGVAPLGLQPFRRSMARIPAPEGLECRAWPMIMGCGESWYAKPDAGALIVSPAEEDPVDPHDAWAEDMVLAEGLARYEAMVTAPVTRLLANWAGLRTFAPDRVLVIGPDPSVPDFFWLAGQGGYGFQTSAAAARHLADLISGRPSDLSATTRAALAPGRLRA